MKEPTVMAQDPIPFKHRLLLGAIPLASVLLRLIGGSLRLRVLDPHHVAPQAKPEPVIYALWHEHQLLGMYAFPNFGIRVLVSRSRDGDYISAALANFGFETVRSSSSSGKVAALRGLAREVHAGRSAAITPDGPRGPVHRAQPGAVFLAAMTGRPLVPMGFAVDHAWRLRSWDRFEIPKPWARAAVVYGQPFAVPRRLDEGSVAVWIARLESDLQGLEAQAWAELPGAKHDLA
jgi:lysophospholipid acyltransferase (LPLAT)-like uncharacterized protein